MSFRGFNKYAAMEISVTWLNNLSLLLIPVSLNAAWQGAAIPGSNTVTGVVRCIVFLKSIREILPVFASIFL